MFHKGVKLDVNDRKNGEVHLNPNKFTIKAGWHPSALRLTLYYVP